MEPKQSTVSVWAHLRSKFLFYCGLNEKTTSEFVNELLTETFARIEANQPNVPSLIIDDIRRKLAKDVEIVMAEDVHRQLAGLDPMAEYVLEEASRNAAQIVPLLLRCRRKGWLWARTRQLVCGALETDLTRQLGDLYDHPLTARAARAGKAGNAETIRMFLETYNILLRHLLALAIAREVPRRFRPLFERPPADRQ